MKLLLHSGILGLCLCAAVARAEQASIGFEGPGEGPAPQKMQEDGYRIVTRNAMISTAEKSGDGTDGANEIEGTMGQRGGIAILRDAPFTFVSLDWQSERGAPEVQVEGYLGDLLVAGDRFVADLAQPGFTRFDAGALKGQVIDRLILYPQRDGAGMGALDRIILEDAPEMPETS
ncbi:hypothetical protein RA2_00026 [Roseovarius sp. A-2]|uniref:hypothetical protein n=1 Tax=Roseovarius sp. A-2 TaxID=1570360 RepID=UPI0009B57AA6|nr:hypothetical protein [Roseovarius sp. A-2]GAW32991.1 hypothetical protein RA2_00026 [Roseovarius sp. A-2]